MEKKNLKDIILKCLTLLLALIFVCSVLYLAEPLLKAERKDIEVTASTKTIVRDGKSYFPRQDITVIMVLGIDKYGERAPANNYRNEGKNLRRPLFKPRYNGEYGRFRLKG